MKRVSAILCFIVSVAAATERDNLLEERIQSNLLVDERVEANEIKVSVEDGIATLRGEVGHLPSKRSAFLIAASTPGVRAVRNQLLVNPSSRSDRDIRWDVLDAMAENQATDAYDIHVVVDDGVVVLSGIVDSYTEKMLAEETARQVHGVREVRNQIKLVARDRGDYEIEQDVEARIRFDRRLARFPIQVDVDDGVVHLRGEVATPAHWYWARTMGWVAGAEEVEARGLRVRERTDEGREAGSASQKSQSDAALRSAVHRAIQQDPLLASTSLRVSIRGNTATVDGTVRTLEQKKRVAAIVKEVSGISSVRNRVALQRTVSVRNEILADRVERAIQRDPYLEDDIVQAQVEHGKVLLVGKVESPFERQRVEKIAGNVFGIREITNAVRVDPLQD